MATDLEQRMQNNQNNAPAQRRPATLSDQIRNMESQFAMAAPKGMEAQQLVRDALTAIRQNPQLAECTHASVLGGLMTCAQLGLRPSVLGHAYLVPFRNKGQLEAQLVVGYQGLVDLAHRSGQIKSLIARTVYENDHFDVDYGLEDKLVHKPAMVGDKGHPVAYYAIAKFNAGGHAFIVMSHDEMLAYKQKNVKLGKFGPWVDHFEAMAHKGLALDTPIPTPAGWSTMGDLKEGETVFDMHGKPTTVTSKSVVKNIDCYRVTFGNGESIVCDGEHRWLAGVGRNAARDVREKGWGVYEIGDLYQAKKAGKRVTMPVAGSLETPDADLPIDPWVLGYWLGNGGARSATVTCAADDAEYVKRAFRDRGFTIGAVRKDSRSNAVSVGVIGGLVTKLRENGLYENKHVPSIYMRGSESQRRELLAGLMDSDGSIDKSRGRAIFTSLDKNLSDAVAELARSLGEVVSEREQVNRGYGKTVLNHVVQWTPSFSPVNMPRKIDRVKAREVASYRAVKSIEKIDSVPTQCIAVDADTRTYLAGCEMVPTHNTVVRQLSKWMPKSTELATAVEVDDSVRVDLAPDAINHPIHIEGEVVDPAPIEP